ncbi:MAG: PorT family protein [Saprospiraceae bacterium]|nr:PorT family protein [Saprospiraceae bacterium]
MKKLMILFVCLAMAQTAIQAQAIKYGVKLGVSTPDIKPADVTALRFKSGTDSFSLKVNDANYGYHIGGWVRLKLAGVYLQPELVFNSSKVEYKLNKIGSSTSEDSVTQRFNNLDLPIMIGFKLGSFRINGGPVAHIHLNGDDGLAALKDYKATFQTATWGYQAGIGLDFGRLGLDLRYEGNFNKFGEHITFGGNQYEFSKTPARMTLAAAISF